MAGSDRREVRVRCMMFSCMLFIGMHAGAQTEDRLQRAELLLEEMMQEVSQTMPEEGGEASAALALEYFQQLLERPLSINRAKRGELERLMFLSGFQIESLLRYREEHGDILSATELSLLNGFNERIASALACFVVFEESGAGSRRASGNFFRDCYSTLWLKGGRRREWRRRTGREEQIGDPYYMYLRYRGDYLEKIQFGFTLEKDAGERFLSPQKIPAGDFLSFHMAWQGVRIGGWNTGILLGDFSARFGQGLTLWNSFSLGSASGPQGLYKRGAPVLPYTSSDETNFLRGVAVHTRKELKYTGRAALKEIGITVLCSRNGVDANVSGEWYTSVGSGGLHTTGRTLKNRRSMHEWLGGANVSLLFNRFRCGISWTSYGYDKRNGRRVLPYNKYQMYDGAWGNLSADFYAVSGRFRFFGEFAADYGLNPAVLLGTVFSVGRGEAGVLARSYSRAYIAPHANGYSTGSGCYNQTGMVCNLLYPVGQRVKLSASLDMTYYPWERWNVPAASAMVKGWVKAEYTGVRWHGHVRFSERFSTDRSCNKAGVRGVLGYKAGHNLEIKGRAEFAYAGKQVREGAGKMPEELPGTGGEARNRACGYAFAADLDYRWREGRCRLQIRTACFCAADWDARIYMYEADLPGSYRSAVLYGAGVKGYALFRYKIRRNTDLYLKGDFCAYIKGGGGNEIPPPRSEIRFGMKIKF